MNKYTTLNLLTAIIVGVGIGFFLNWMISDYRLLAINSQVSQSVKQQQISNTNDMCFEYMNNKIQKDLHNK